MTCQIYFCSEKNVTKNDHFTVADPGFPVGGAPTS